MSIDKPEWKDAFVRLLALASRLEGEGQYNLAKLARAASDAMSRRAAYQLAMPSDKGNWLPRSSGLPLPCPSSVWKGTCWMR